MKAARLLEAAFIVVCTLYTSSSARADLVYSPNTEYDVHYTIAVKCDHVHRTVTISPFIDTDDLPPAIANDPNVATYDFDALPHYIVPGNPDTVIPKRLGTPPKPKLVCAFGAKQNIGLISVRNISHQKYDGLHIFLDGHDAPSFDMYAAYGGSITFTFNRAGTLHVDDCRNWTDSPDDEKCRARDFRTTFTHSSANHPSFDCKKATTVAEQLICDDASLSAADRELAGTYHSALVAGGDHAKLVSDQKAWVQSGRWASCMQDGRGLYPADINGAKACLARAYDDRIQAIKASIAK